ncbi:hypothetical protein BFC19_12305 (plasmid) [Brochothrix thermosphacta]|uniref:hypothetical protein n=1 Tax=Brochothrix thermosphacta TaxID=2756 RepID=UPI000E707FD1|nr:hypothetical protein [Brochothrix thermosphacta]ANZ96218.1 hypothetical protein BFC19_12305 [Brochothrix thermosphacta]
MPDHSSANGFYYLFDGNNKREKVSPKLAEVLSELSYESDFETKEMPHSFYGFSANGRNYFEQNLNIMADEINQVLPTKEHDLVFEYEDASWNKTEGFHVEERYSIKKGLELTKDFDSNDKLNINNRLDLLNEMNNSSALSNKTNSLISNLISTNTDKEQQLMESNHSMDM